MWPIQTQTGAPKSVTLPNGKVAKLTKGSSGSNPGGFYETPDGETLFLKFPKSVGQVGAENTSAELARMMGLQTKDYVAFSPDASHVAIGSPKITFQKLSAKAMAAQPKSELADQFVHAAWTRNWDVVGLDFDNMVMLQNGKLSVIDHGGSLLWRAQGDLKPGGLPKIVDELKTLRDASKNSQTASVFGQLTDQDIAQAIQKRLVDLDDDDILAAVARGKFASEQRKVIEKGLLERKQWLSEWADDVLDTKATGTADQIFDELIGTMPTSAEKGLKLKAGGPHVDTAKARYAAAQQGDANAMAKLGRGLWAGTDSFEQDQDLALRLLQTAWNKNPDAVKAELGKFSETMQVVLDALEAQGTGKLSTHAVSKHIAAAEKLVAKQKAAEAATAAKQAAELQAKQAAKKAELAAKKAAYEEDLAAWKPKYEAWQAKVDKITGKKTTKTGAVTAAYERKLETWAKKLAASRKNAEVRDKAKSVLEGYRESTASAQEALKRAKDKLSVIAESEKVARASRGFTPYHITSAKRVANREKRNAAKALKEAKQKFQAEVEVLAKDGGILPAPPQRPAPPAGMGGAERPTKFNQGRGAPGVPISESYTRGHPAWEARRSEMRAIGRELGYAEDRIEREIQELESAIRVWKGSAAPTRKAQRDLFMGVPEDQVGGNLQAAKAFDSELWKRAAGHEGDLWRGEHWVNDAKTGGRTIAGNKAWLKEHLSGLKASGDTWTWPYSQGFSTQNGFQGAGYGGGMPIQYHIRGKSSARSFKNIAGFEGEAELQTRPGAQYRVVDFTWERDGDKVWIDLVEVFDDGTTGLD